MERSKKKSYPLSDKDYKLCEEIGEGVSATVYRALCIPLNEEVAIKVLDLERCNNDLDGIRREVQTMSLINHPNLLRAHCSFTSGHSLWVVTPYMAAGSCVHIMKSSYPEGFEEAVIATLLREVLKALIYLHAQGHIHRDVKAGNILIDSNGAVKLADFGVSACMFHAGDRQHSRNTFVGTPCWMAPEVMQQLHGYDFKADIWSFGITALELAHGHAPFSKYPPMKVLLMTLQNAPPGLDYERDKRFSKSFKEMVATCLAKDPKKRPTSEKLLKHSFFKHGRSSDYLARTILGGLLPLGDRFRIVKENEADLLAQNKVLHENKEQLSQQEYIRGISAWNFNLEDLKNEATHIQDGDGNSNEEDHGESVNQMDTSSNNRVQTERPSPDRTTCSDSTPSHEEGFSDLNDLESSLASFPIKPLQALKGCFDICDDDPIASSPQFKEFLHPDHQQLLPQSSLRSADSEIRRDGRESMGHIRSLPHHVFPEHKKFYSGSLVLELDSAHKKFGAEGSRDALQPRNQSERNYSGPLLYSRKTDTNNLSYVDDAQGGAVVQRKGRFKVTSADPSPKDPSNCSSSPLPGGSTSPTIPNLSVTSVLPSLQCILQQNIMQKEEIVKLIKHMELTSGKHADSAEASTNDLMQELQTSTASAKEKELQSHVSHLQQSVGSLVEELQKQKLKNAQLERQVNAIVNRGKEKDNADITCQ